MPDPPAKPVKCCRQRRRWSASALTALVISATASLWAGPFRPPDALQLPSEVSAAGATLGEAAPLVDGRAAFTRQTPPILRPTYTGNVELEIVYGGSVPLLRVFRASGGPPTYSFDEFPRVATGTIGGQAVSIFRPSWPMGDFLQRFGLAVDFDNGIGASFYAAPSTVPLGPNGFPTISDSIMVRAMSTTVANVPVVQIDATAQYSSHVVNLVVPALANSLDVVPAARLFYAYFGDDYEQLAFVFREYVDVGAGHSPVQSSISGINLPPRNFSADYGSAGRLEGVTVYSDRMDNAHSNHELGHQWGHYFDWERIIGIRGFGIHSPVWSEYESPLTNNSIIASNERLRSLGGGQWELVRAAEPTRLPPLQAYAMGLIEAGAVPPVDIFENQALPRLGEGQRISGTTRRATIDQVIAIHGARVGPVVTSVRQATILLSRDALATPEEMAYWTLRAQRLEDPFQTGMINEDNIGSFRATTGVPLHTRIVPPPGGPVLAGHTLLEPDVLDPRDLAGLELDTAPRLDVPYIGVFRMQGRIVDARLRAWARSIGVQWGGGTTRFATVAADGTFSLIASPEMGIRRNFQRTFLVDDRGLQHTISLVRNVRVFGNARVPPPPVALAATATGSSVSIRWSPDTGWPPTGYFLDAGSSPGATDIGSFPTTTPALSASGVPNGRYYLRVRARNAEGMSGPSPETVLTVGCAPPLPPTMLTGAVNGTSVTLNWQASPSTGVSYIVVAGTSPGASNIAQVPVGTVTSLTANAPPGRYFVRVRAVAGPCGAAESNEVELAVGLPQLPGAPANLTHQVNAGTVTLTWQASAGTVGGYIVEAGSQSGSANLAVIPLGNVLTLSAPGVPPGTYFVRVRGFNAAGQGPPSNETTVVVP